MSLKAIILTALTFIMAGGMMFGFLVTGNLFLLVGWAIMTLGGGALSVAL